jgi:alkyldihydroxyacetonephosphate synthase
LAAEGERVHVFTHLSHVYGEGSSIYTTYVFRPAADYPATLARWKALKHVASQTIVDNHGTISHQHGVGKDHAPYLLREKGALAMDTLQALSKHFDPAGRLNPGTLLPE